MGEGGQKVQTSSYKISQSQDVMYNVGTLVNNAISCNLKIAKRVDLKSLTTRKKFCNYVKLWMLKKKIAW